MNDLKTHSLPRLHPGNLSLGSPGRKAPLASKARVSKVKVIKGPIWSSQVCLGLKQGAGGSLNAWMVRFKSAFYASTPVCLLHRLYHLVKILWSNTANLPQPSRYLPRDVRAFQAPLWLWLPPLTLPHGAVFWLPYPKLTCAHILPSPTSSSSRLGPTFFLAALFIHLLFSSLCVIYSNNLSHHNGQQQTTKIRIFFYLFGCVGSQLRHLGSPFAEHGLSHCAGLVASPQVGS